jgi:RHS repeat-associated protein
VLRLALLFAALLLCALPARAQVVTGSPPFSSSTPSTFDTVNDANLNVSFAVPVVSKAGRGIPFNYSLVYNNSVWVPYNSSGASVWTPVPGWGWGSANSATTGSVTYLETQASCYYPPGGGPGGTMYYWNVYVFDYYYDPNGTQHQINKNVSSWTSSIPCSNGASFPNTASGTLTDGSGYSYTVNSAPGALVYPPSGLTITVPAGGATQGGVTDTNGNSVSFSTSSGTTTFTDTLGLTALTVSGSGTYSSPMTYTYAGPAGQISVQVNYSVYTVRTNFACSGITEYGPTQISLVSSITLPDNTSYSLTYEATPGYSGDVTGRLASVTLPTGGTISYAYSGGSNNGIICQDASVPTLTRTVNPGGTWTYAHTEGTSTSTTEITDPDSNQTVITFDGVYASSDQYEEQRTIYNGSQSSGNVMETINTCYNGASIPCVGTAFNLPITELAVTRALSTSSGGTVESETNTYYNSYAFVTKVDEYDFGSGGVGTFKRETMSCPYSFTNSYIQNRPQYVMVYSATGNPSGCTGNSGLVAETTYGYDSNGNLLTESHTNTTGSPSSISRSFTYGSYGALTASTDFNGNQTTYTNTACNNSFPTTITPAISSLAVTETWNCNGGVVTKVTDPNGQPTTYTYNDPFWRLTETQYPDGGQTNVSYTDSNGAFSVETSRLLSGSACTGTNCHQVTQSLDGLGRVISAVDGQACNGAGSTVTTSYDSLGRVSAVSNPYCTKSDSSYGFTTYGYDAMSRVNSIGYPDTAAASIGYSGNCSTATDPANKLRTLCSDALGRITSVAEDPNNLNYQTAYTYDDLNDLTGVAQGSSQTRTYGYDMLGRLTSAKVPEVNSGGTQCSTTYGHDANGNLTSKTAPLGNQTSCSSTVTTTYAYDAANRLTSKSYSDSTPPATFTYDQSSVTIGGWTSPTLAYPLGRLVGATTTQSGSVKTGVVYSYDPLGRVGGLWQCNPSNCGISAYAMTYTYDKAGDVSTWTHPDTSLHSTGITLTNTLNSAQQVTAMQSSWQDTSHPQYLAENVTYTAWGAATQLEDGCVGSGCVNTFETYTYNNRLQPWMIQLGTSSNSYADYCLVYNYFSSWTAPSNCPQPSSVPTSGSGNNGNVMGYWYQDSVNSSFGHTASYGYDGVNRLNAACTLSGTQCATSGSNVYNLAFGYDQYGNMDCTGGVGGGSAIGYCQAWTYNSGTNQLTTSGFTYDAAGNLTKDSSNPTAHTYQWDAEGRVASVDSGSTWTFTYNALGERVQWASSSATYQQVFDANGGWLGEVGVYDILRWGSGFFVVYTASETDFNHTNNLSSTTMYSNHGGTVVEDMLFYPWGQVWQSWGSGGYNFADLPDNDTTTDTNLTLNRLQSPGLGRWMSPDPAGLVAVDPSNPQSWNRYAYVLNNPTTLTDRLGLSPNCLVQRSGRPHAMNTPTTVCGGWYEGGGGISIDGGGAFPSGLFGAGGGGESAVACPGNVCSGVATDADGNSAWVQFYAFASGISGYYDPTDLADGIYDYNGRLYNYANYQALLSQEYASQISAQCGTLSGNLAAASGGAATVNCTSALFIQGGHANFLIDCGAWLGGDCAGRWLGGLHIQSETLDDGETIYWGHNDTASYYMGTGFNWATFSLWNLVLHGVVDYLGGNTALYVFPH